MDWWTVLKGRGKIRIPAKRKRLKKNPNRSKAIADNPYGRTARDRKRDMFVERQNRMAARKDREARARAFNPLAGINDDRNPINIGEPIVGNRRDRLVSTKRGPIHQFRRGKPTLTNEDRETNRLAREHSNKPADSRYEFADVLSFDEDDEETRSDADGLMAYLSGIFGIDDRDKLRQAVNDAGLDLEGLQQRLLHTPVNRTGLDSYQVPRYLDEDDIDRLEWMAQGRLSPYRGSKLRDIMNEYNRFREEKSEDPTSFPMAHAMQALRERAFIPKRQKSVAHDRPGFRTGGGETLPLPDSQRDRDMKELNYTNEWIEDNSADFPEGGLWAQLGNIVRNTRADKVNRPVDNISWQDEQRMKELNERIAFLQNQQYDRAGNRIQGEQNE